MCEVTATPARDPSLLAGRHRHSVISISTSDKKNRYVYKVVDIATWRSEAVALVCSETERVAETLLEIFLRTKFS